LQRRKRRVKKSYLLNGRKKKEFRGHGLIRKTMACMGERVDTQTVIKKGNEEVLVHLDHGRL